MAKILHISEFTKGGIETHLNELLHYQKDNHDIYLMVSEQNSSRESLLIKPERLLMYPYRRKPKYFLQAMKLIHRTVKEINPDIVHVHGTFAGVFLRTLLFLKKKRPIVIYCSHGWAFLMDTKPWKRKVFALVEKLLSLRTDVMINISKHEYQMAVKYGLPPKKSVVVYNGVTDAAVTQPVSLPGNNERINLLYVGRFDRQKGFDLLLDVFNEQELMNVNLYLVGDTVLKQADYHYPPNAVRLGWVDNAQIDRYIQACDALIVPSRWEGFGIVAIEALRNGKPVIASNRGALPEIIEHGVNGYIFDFNKKEELASIIRGLSKAELEEMGQRGAAIFREKFHADKMNEQIESLYEDAMRKRSGRYPAAANHYV